MVVDGRIEHEGSFAELMQQGALQQLLEECEKDIKKKLESDEEEEGLCKEVQINALISSQSRGAPLNSLYSINRFLLGYEDDDSDDYARDHDVGSPFVDHVG